MCVVAICNDRKLTKDEFTNCFTSNSHGAGFGWINPDNTVQFAKGFMNEKEAWDYYKTIKVLPHIAHFRIASSGAKSAELTHPFLITEKSELKLTYKGLDQILFHNGVISNWRNYLIQVAMKNPDILSEPEADVSDTRVVAMLASMTNVHVIDHVIGTDKVVVLSPLNGITYWGAWDEQKGVMFSNSSYVARSYVYASMSSGYTYPRNNDTCKTEDEEYDSKWWDKVFKDRDKKKKNKAPLEDPFYFEDEITNSRYGKL